jgi:hypothetical protein
MIEELTIEIQSLNDENNRLTNTMRNSLPMKSSFAGEEPLQMERAMQDLKNNLQKVQADNRQLRMGNPGA